MRYEVEQPVKYQTACDVTMVWPDSTVVAEPFRHQITIPEGTELWEITGGRGPCYVVASRDLVATLSGDMHMASNRFCFIPKDKVKIISGH